MQQMTGCTMVQGREFFHRGTGRSIDRRMRRPLRRRLPHTMERMSTRTARRSRMSMWLSGWSKRRWPYVDKKKPKNKKLFADGKSFLISWLGPGTGETQSDKLSGLLTNFLYKQVRPSSVFTFFVDQNTTRTQHEIDHDGHFSLPKRSPTRQSTKQRHKK